MSDDRLRADALCRLLVNSDFVGDEETHAALRKEALDAASTVGDPHLTAQILHAASSSPRVTQSERVLALEESLALTRQTGDQVLYVRILTSLGYLAMDEGDICAARPYLEEATRLVRVTGDQFGLTGCTLNLGFASYVDGADGAARGLFDEALRIAQRNSDLYTVAHARLGFALLTARAGDAIRAASLHGTTNAILETLGARFGPVEARLRDADIAALRARLGDSAFERAYNAARMIEASGEPAFA